MMDSGKPLSILGLGSKEESKVSPKNSSPKEEQFILFDKSVLGEGGQGNFLDGDNTLADMSKILNDETVQFIDDEEQMELFE